MRMERIQDGDVVARGGRVYAIRGETDRLTEVLICRPSHLQAVPCCSVTRESIGDGFAPSIPEAMAQHLALEEALERNGVRVHQLRPGPGMPDQCFMRDSAVMTPWGLLGLRPAAPHRRDEVNHVLDAARDADVTVLGRVEVGTLEGGDVCVARDGLLIVGFSDERTDEQGATDLAALFAADGWRTIVYRFDPHFLHLDTQFCMVGSDLALACVDVLRKDFLDCLADSGIELIPVSYKEGRALGCNLLSLGDRRLISSAAHPRVANELRSRGYQVDTVDVSQFERCGGGVHCLTLPLAREGL